jgi:hypothetical protein
MCDYSLHAVASRPAKAGDRLISTSFSRTSTRGFAAEAERDVAVCLLPGTELSFADHVKYYRNWLWPTKAAFNVARFRKVDASSYEPHQDALEFPDGKIVQLTALVRGQRARVLQLPAKAKVEAGSEASRSTLSKPATAPQPALPVSRSGAASRQPSRSWPA